VHRNNTKKSVNMDSLDIDSIILRLSESKYTNVHAIPHFLQFLLFVSTFFLLRLTFVLLFLINSISEWVILVWRKRAFLTFTRHRVALFCFSTLMCVWQIHSIDKRRQVFFFFFFISMSHFWRLLLISFAPRLLDVSS